MSQPLLINRIIDTIPGLMTLNPMTYPALLLVILTRDKNGPHGKEKWNYRSVMGILKFMMNSTHPELSYAVQQCARFYNDPMLIYDQAVRRIVQYLRSTTRKEESNKYSCILFTIDKTKSITVYIDASFTGE